MSNNIEINLLGTGSSVPTAKRNHPGILLKYKNESILFDCGEGIQRQFRKAHENPMRITRLFITHWHGDHVLGIPGLLNTLYLNGYDRTFEVYGPKGTKRYMEKLLDFFVHNWRANVKIHELSKGKAIDTEDYFIEAFPMNHNTPALAYSFVVKDKLRIDKKKLKKLNLKIHQRKELKKLKQGKDVVINGKKIKFKTWTYLQKGKKIAIVMDTKLNNNMAKIAKDSDLFISECTFLDNKVMADEKYHMIVEQVAKVAKSAKAKKLVLIHISQRHDLDEKLFLGIAKKYVKDVIIGEDLMKFEI